MKYSKLLNSLKKLYQKDKFNLALHTTKKEYVESILKYGIEERGFRKIEGTIKFIGNVKEHINEKTLDFFFPLTDTTMLIALPDFLDTIPTRESYGGNYTTCDFSRFLEALILFKCRHKPVDEYILNKFTYNCFKVIPNEMIIGYYDQEENFYINENCYLFTNDKIFITKLETEYSRLLELIKQDYRYRENNL